MTSEKQETTETEKMVETSMEKAHNASEGHFGHSGKSYLGGFTDAHQGQPGASTAQSLAQAMGGFPSGGSAISDPNPPAPLQATASNTMPTNPSEPAEE